MGISGQLVAISVFSFVFLLLFLFLFFLLDCLSDPKPFSLVQASPTIRPSGSHRRPSMLQDSESATRALARLAAKDPTREVLEKPGHSAGTVNERDDSILVGAQGVSPQHWA